MTSDLNTTVTTTSNESFSNFSKSSWPASGPKKNEKQVFSISIGNSTIQWALHGERHNDLNPTTFWRTPHLTMEETCGNKQEKLNCFTQCLCQSLTEWFFGLETESPSIEAMKKQNEKRGFKPTFYIISSNSEQTTLVSRLMHDLPCRLIELQKTDFFTQEQGAYPNMGIDRLATLYAALKTCGAPALVFDGGTALTYAATDDNGNVLGGGITAGLQMRFDAMHTGTDALPPCSVPEFVEPLVDRCIRVSKPLDTFASDTKLAMVSSNLMEVASLMRSVHKQWIDVVGGKNKRKKDSDVFVNKNRQVVICGGSTELLMKLCDEDYSGILQGKVEKINVKKLAGLAHFAVSHILEEKCLKRRKEPSAGSTQSSSTQNKAPVISPRKESAESIDAKRAKLEKYVGESLVKHFVDENTGESVPYGGHVERLWIDEEGTFLFRVNYLDGDTEDVELEDVKEYIKAYKNQGPTVINPQSNPEGYIGTRVAKYFFGTELYFGSVKKYNADGCYWWIEYDDGDGEEFDENELIEGMTLRDQNANEDVLSKP